MIALPLAIRASGMVSPVGLGVEACCAALRAKVANPTQTRYRDLSSEWIIAHQVELERPLRGMRRLARMAAMAIDDCLSSLPAEVRQGLPLVLCIAELDRPGRLLGIDEQLRPMIEGELGIHFSNDSAVVPHGRVSAAVGLAGARRLIQAQRADHVLIASVDSLLEWATLRHLEERDLLLTDENSDGFIPGEGAGALLVGAEGVVEGSISCSGIGFGVEVAHVDSGLPNHASGLRQAVCQALAEAGCNMQDVDFRITDLSGPQYYFKEAALLLSRLIRHRPERVELWHPAECVGEQGAVAGMYAVALACESLNKGYAPGPGVLVHMANDCGKRAALSLRPARAA